MKSQKTSTTETMNENINSASDLISETTSAMSEIYNKSFELGSRMFGNFMNVNSKEHTKSMGFDFTPFRTGVEMMQKSTHNFSDLSKKVMTEFAKYSNGIPMGLFDGKKSVENILSVYDMEIKQMAKVNQDLMKVFNDSFNGAHKEIDRLFDIFLENIEVNLRTTGKEMKNIMAAYSFALKKSSESTPEMFSGINEQIEILTQNNLKLWENLMLSVNKVNTASEQKRDKVNPNK